MNSINEKKIYNSRCCNLLTSIPPEIGYLKNLTILSLSKNRLTSLPDTIGLLSKLVELRVSENQLTTIPSSIGMLKKLTTLFLEHNQITHLPSELGQLSTLVYLDVSDNPLRVIPAEINKLKYIRRIKSENCPLLDDFSAIEPFNPPTLKELAARTIVRLQLPIFESTQHHLKEYLKTSHECSSCGGPYFETYAKRGRCIDRAEYKVTLEYRLCSPHWSSEGERILDMFSPIPTHTAHPFTSSLPSAISSSSSVSAPHNNTTSLSSSNSTSFSTSSSSSLYSSSSSFIPGGSLFRRRRGSIAKTGTSGLQVVSKRPLLPALPRLGLLSDSEVSDDQSIISEGGGRRFRRDGDDKDLIGSLNSPISPRPLKSIIQRAQSFGGFRNRSTL